MKKIALLLLIITVIVCFFSAVFLLTNKEIPKKDESDLVELRGSCMCGGGAGCGCYFSFTNESNEKESLCLTSNNQTTFNKLNKYCGMAAFIIAKGNVFSAEKTNVTFFNISSIEYDVENPYMNDSLYCENNDECESFFTCESLSSECSDVKCKNIYNNTMSENRTITWADSYSKCICISNQCVLEE